MQRATSFQGGAYRWQVVAMLWLVCFFNYADRQAIYAVFPLLKNKPELVAKAREVQALLRPHMTAFYDEAGAIGRRYRRQDEAGTPYGITIDFDTLGEKGPELKDTVTLRERDSMKQERVRIADLLPMLLEKVR